MSKRDASIDKDQKVDSPLALEVIELDLLERTLLDGGTGKVATDGQSAG